MEPREASPEPSPVHPHRPTLAACVELLAAFGKLGLISFGGPVAHLGYYRAEFVEKRRWISDADYADLVALCQFLPGPASSQVVFALGMQRAGVPGGLVASASFTLPSALLLVAFGYGVATIGDLSRAGWLHGLKLAAVAVVAQAVWGMGRTLCPDRARQTLCLCAAAVLLLVPGAISQIGVIAAGALAGWLLYRRHLDPPPALETSSGRRTPLAAATALVAFFALLVLLPALAATSQSRSVAVFDSFYRSGSLVFGGGHVVLPLLRAEVVPKGWVDDDEFLAGYGAAQAVPGPLFTFAAYLGTVMAPGPSWSNGMWCLLAIFLPAWLLIGGTLPYWHRLRRRASAQAALRGANAAVVGVLLAALYNPVITEAVRDVRDVAFALLAFAALLTWRAPPWAVVLALAGIGQWVLA
jgi:chromate transporter